MEIKFKNVLSLFRKRILLFIMRTLVFLCCLTVFGFTPDNVLSQNSKVKIEISNSLTVDEVFDLIMEQTDYKFIYQEGVFKDLPKIKVKKGVISANKLLNKSLSSGNFNVVLSSDNTILVEEMKTTINKVQGVRISGTVTDNAGQPLLGANILEKGTTNGTQTNFDGEFTIEVTSKNAVLIISYVGYKSKEVLVDNLTDLSIVLDEDTASLDEVLIVGYGTQKKINLTGAVDEVSGNILIQRPATNSANLLQGRISGVDVIQPSAEPGQNNPTIQIRGLGSFGGSNDPLILIDGAAGSLSNLSPDMIENVTVLKDAASSAIYGARAANGVILVTTKKGKKGKPVVSYRGNFSVQTPTALPNFVDNSAEYMTMFNTAYDRSNPGQIYYPESEIEKYRNGTYPWNFNSVDYWFKNATVQNHNVSLSGGGEKSVYNFSLSALTQDAMAPGYKYNRYNGLFNYSIDVNDWFTMSTSFNLTSTEDTRPPMMNLFVPMYIYATSPLSPPYLPDGRVAGEAYVGEQAVQYRQSPQEVFDLIGSQFFNTNNLNAHMNFVVKPLKGLTWNTKFAINYQYRYFKMHQKDYKTYFWHNIDIFPDDGIDVLPNNQNFDAKGAEVPGVTDEHMTEFTPTVFSTLSYDTTLDDDHNISAMAGFEQVSFRRRILRANRPSSVAPHLTDLQGYSTEGEKLYNTHFRLAALERPEEWGIRSFFGRVAYNYQEKYLFEANLRYDGTSKVSPDYRWGLFPSASAGWVVSKEKFIKDKIDWLDHFKIRASYGKLGNQNIGSYLYQNNLSISSGYSFDEGYAQGAQLTSFRDQSLQWETTEMTDIGIDIKIKNSLFGVSFDYFNKNTYDILASVQIPSSSGLGSPTVNNGKMNNKGFELELTHVNNIGDEFFYDVNFMLTKYKNEVISIYSPRIGATIRDVGLPYDQFNLWVWDGVFQESDITSGNYPTHERNVNPRAGDLKMKDVDGDGDVDGDDRVPISGRYPDFNYSFGFNFKYKNFGLNMFFQGVEGRKAHLPYWTPNSPFGSGIPPIKDWRNAWTPDNPTNSMPALHIDGYSGVSAYANSTYFLHDTSYLRLKNVMLSYNVPESISKKIGAQDLTVYVSGDNLITWTDFKNQDPERHLSSFSTVFLSWPQARMFNVGLNVKF
ncbi:SusC/RagA family TonB-linked outer membrane protein [Thalassobellus citreus]|uniref:SusC/RagA family TonB-linked outer membrane protein n=1 Tax=Thalassobellus citreus TaxID=3367752 RepID=UPI0037B477CF